MPHVAQVPYRLNAEKLYGLPAADRVNRRVFFRVLW
jgi:hypothetical protein